MNLSVGIVGLPNAGKSTLFNALVGRKQAETGEHPFTTIHPNKAVVDIPDERLERLFEMTKIAKKTPAKLTFVDVAGLVKGAHQGEGLGNEFLGHIRIVDAIIHVLRAFPDSQVSHPLGEINPEQDRQIVETELVLADLAFAEKHLAEKGLANDTRLFFEKAKAWLETGKWLNLMSFTEQERLLLKAYPFLTTKKLLHVVNVAESDWDNEPFLLGDIKALKLSAKTESDLSELPWTEQRQYLKSLNLQYSALEAIVAACAGLLQTAVFYTLAGGKELRAWIFPQGTTAYDAAGMIHTDMQKGFIKAEVLSFEDFTAFSSWEKAKQAGKVALHGREYLVADGDLIEIKFSK